MRSERSALTLSTLAALGIGGLALAVGVVTGSGAILLDGAFNLCFFAAALLTLRVARLLGRPDDARYPFGYVQFEPLVNLVKGLLIIGVGLVATIDAALALSRGGAGVPAGLAIGYAAFALVACGAVLLTLRRAARRLASPLVQADVENWAVNAAISLGMLAAFALAMLLDRAGHAGAARLVDPILVILVVLLTLAVPVRMSARALLGLLQRAPGPDIAAEVEEVVRAATAAVSPERVFVRALLPGRTLYVLVHVLLDARAAGLTLAEADALRADILAGIVARRPAVVDVVFTMRPALAEPVAAFTRANLPAPPRPAG